MTTTTNEPSKDQTHIGDMAAKQPLSGTRVVTSIRVKGVSSNMFSLTSEPKKSA